MECQDCFLGPPGTIDSQSRHPRTIAPQPALTLRRQALWVKCTRVRCSRLKWISQYLILPILWQSMQGQRLLGWHGEL